MNQQTNKDKKITEAKKERLLTWKRNCLGNLITLNSSEQKLNVKYNTIHEKDIYHI